MQPTSLPLRAPRPLAAALAALLLTAGLTACGGGDDTPSAGAARPSTTAAPTSAASAPPAASPDDTPGGQSSPATSSELESSRAGADGQGDFTAGPAARAPGIAKVPASAGLPLSAPAGSKLHWTADSRLSPEREFCLHLAIPGPYDPEPNCTSGTLLSLAFFSDDAAGHAIGRVDQAPVTRREAPTQLVVSGFAAGDVKQVTVSYAQQRFPATLSTRAVRLPVDRSLARVLSGATTREIARLPSKIVVRTFGVSFPRDSGNPPQTVTAESVQPVNGEVTLQLG